MPPTAAATESPSGPVSIDDAFAAAKSEHTAPAEPAAATTTTTEPAAPAATSTPAAPASSTHTGAEPSADLLSDDEYNALAAQHKDDPAAFRKALNAAFTQKTQALAELRGQVEPVLELVEGLNTDPEATLAELAEQYGLRLAKPDGTPGPTTTTTTATDAVTAALDDFKASLPEEYKFLGDELGPAFKAMAEKIAASVIEKHVEPLRATSETLVERAALEQTDATMKAFAEKRPDWQQHEGAMLQLAQKLAPNGMSELEYLDTLYFLATKDQAAATAATAAVTRMSREAERAEPTTTGTPESRVKREPPAKPSFDDAFEAAKRGERWE